MTTDIQDIVSSTIDKGKPLLLAQMASQAHVESAKNRVDHLRGELMRLRTEMAAAETDLAYALAFRAALEAAEGGS